MQFLLIIACSHKKDPQSELLPAIERYDGPTFRLLRRFLSQNPSFSLDIYILSAKYGLIHSSELIPFYDEKMTKKRSLELQPEVNEKLKDIVNNSSDKKVYFCLGKVYFAVIDGYSRYMDNDIEIDIATGSIGNKLFKLHTWLYGKPPDLSLASPRKITSDKVIFKGVEIKANLEQVTEIARQALREKKGKPFAYQSWYVLIDDQKVSPKWLVSQLTGFPVGKFHSQAARKLLLQLGFEIFCK
ncbi:MAG: DUF6884 domain-containing protein [Microcystaceae cyanobacterium]